MFLWIQISQKLSSVFVNSKKFQKCPFANNWIFALLITSYRCGKLVCYPESCTRQGICTNTENCEYKPKHKFGHDATTGQVCSKSFVNNFLKKFNIFEVSGILLQYHKWEWMDQEVLLCFYYCNFGTFSIFSS